MSLIDDLRKISTVKKVVCPCYEKLTTVVDDNGDSFNVVVYVSKHKKARIGTEKQKKLLDNQKVWEYYKRVKEINEDDKDFDRDYPRFARVIKELLERSGGDLIKIFKAIEWTKDYISKMPNGQWNLGTVAKKWHESQDNTYFSTLRYLSDEERVSLRRKDNGHENSSS